MNHELYVSPRNQAPLRVSGDTLIDDAGENFEMSDKITNLVYPRSLVPADATAQHFYNGRAEAYDENLHLTFFTHDEDEQVVRNGLIDLLHLTAESKVLEIAAGTGRDSELLVQRLGTAGHLVATDIARNMLARCVQRIERIAPSARTDFALANACHLPFADNAFDAVYSFGGLGEFSDIRGSLAEMVRVTRVGGRIVVGDESMPPWLRETEFAKILTTTNPMFAARLPLEDLPVEARDVVVRWVIGGVFYVIDFTVAEGEPTGNFDFEIPGVRGGTLRTRYEGQLGGVSREAFELAHRAREKSGKSMHQWLDEAVRRAANDQLQ